MEEEVSNNGGPWRARMNSRAPRQKEKKKKIKIEIIHVLENRSSQRLIDNKFGNLCLLHLITSLI